MKRNYSWKIKIAVVLTGICLVTVASNAALESAADKVKQAGTAYKRAYDDYERSVQQLNNAKSYYERAVKDYEDELSSYRRNLRN